MCRNLSLITQNIRSINANFSSFGTLLQRINVDTDVIILTECWLPCCSTVPHLPGYYNSSTKLNKYQNDGVVVYVRESLSFTLEELQLQDANCIFIKIGDDTAIVAVYRSPAIKNKEPFLTSLNDTLSKLNTFKNIILAGDLNIAINCDKIDAAGESYLDMTAFQGLLPAHTLVTRDESGTCLDHILLRTKYPSMTMVVQSSVTDHKAILFYLEIKSTRSYAVTSITKIDSESLKKDLNNIDLSPINTKNAEESLEYLNTSIQAAIVKNTKTKTLPSRKKIIRPWITTGLLRCTRNRDILHKKSKRSPDNEILKLTYTRYRNFCNSLLRKLKRSYEKEQIDKAGNNCKKLWNTIKTITNTTKNKSIPKELLSFGSTPLESVNNINSFFANIGKTLAEANNNENKLSTLPQEFNEFNSMVLLATDEEEVECLVMGLKSECSVGCDKIPNRLIKEHKSLLIPPLTLIFNKCIDEGVFPKLLKRAEIRPIHKGGDRDCINNYRPISILPSMSKILEKILNNRLTKFLTDNNIISNNQYGFRSGLSTDGAVHTLTDHIASQLDQGNKCIGVFLDLAKAFDTVSVPLLLQKLQSIGVRGDQFKIFSSYLEDRFQHVCVNDYVSDVLQITHGVPQGSILGPTLFLIYINDLLNLSSFPGKILSYADDTALLFSSKTWDETFKLAQQGFVNVQRWLNMNSLTLNRDKTKYLAFSIRNTSAANTHGQIIVHNCNCSDSANCECPRLEKVDSIRYLGIILDQNLNFKLHIASLSKKIRKLTYIFKNLRHILDPNRLKQIYLALCQSLICYCISSWGGASKTVIEKVEIAQRLILKVCTFRPYLFPTSSLYEFCQVLTVRQLFVLSIIIRQHRSMQYTPPQNVRRFYTVVKNKTRPNTEFVKRFYIFLGPYLYNNINKILNIYPLVKVICKRIVSKWLQTLTYNQTEDLIKVIK